MFEIIRATAGYLKRCLLLALFLYILYSLITGLGNSIMSGIEKTDERVFLTDDYRFEAVRQADKFMTPIERGYWEGKGLSVIESKRGEGFISYAKELAMGDPHKKFQGQKVAEFSRDYIDSGTFLRKNVSYKGNGVYHVKISLTSRLETVAPDRPYVKYMDKVNRNYMVYIKAENETGMFGNKVKWKLLGYELENMSPSERIVNKKINELVIPRSEDESIKHMIENEGSF